MRKNYIYVLLFLLGNCLLSACSNNSGFHEGHYYFNFDDLSCYVKNDPTLVKDNAKSGLYCLKIDSAIKFGLAFNQRIGDISSKPIDKIKLSGWVRCNNVILLKGQLVCQIDSAGETVLWYGEDFNKFVNKSDEWIKVNVDFALSKNNNINNIIKIYPVNYGGETFYFDDLEIAFKK